MNPDSSLKQKLHDMSIPLSADNQLRDVKLTQDMEAYIANMKGIFGMADGETVTINPYHAELLDAETDVSKKQEFGLLLNTLSHEIEHDQVSDPEGKEKFTEEYPTRPQLAATARNLVEDVYIDERRLSRDRGLRPMQALFAELVMDGGNAPCDKNGKQRYTIAMDQIAKAGYVDEIERASDDLREFVVKVKTLFEKARNSHTPVGRDHITHKLMDVIEEHIGVEELTEDEIEEMPFTPKVMPADMGQMDIPEQDDTAEPNTQAAPDSLDEMGQETAQEDNESTGAGEGQPMLTNESQDDATNDAGGDGDSEDPLCGECGATLVTKPLSEVSE